LVRIVVAIVYQMNQAMGNSAFLCIVGPTPSARNAFFFL
jgi:hypothetical protein